MPRITSLASSSTVPDALEPVEVEVISALGWSTGLDGVPFAGASALGAVSFAPVAGEVASSFFCSGVEGVAFDGVLSAGELPPTAGASPAGDSFAASAAETSPS